MTDPNDPKTVLARMLQAARDSLLWKLEGLSEREVRLPRTSTGTNLLGLVKHALNVEAGYFGPTFGRPYPHPEDLVSDEQFEADPQTDLYAAEDETMADLVDRYRRVWAFADETIAALPLDAIGRVAWWSPDRATVTLHRILVHVIGDLMRHAGHADILREELDGAVGLTAGNDNIPAETDWSAYRAKLGAIADRFA